MKIPNSEGTPQRTATRAPIDKPIRLQFDDAIEVLEGRCRNISIGGVFVELAAPQAHGSLARFELVLDEEHSIRGLGEVVWARTGNRGGDKVPGIGIKFRFLEQRDRQRIFKLVSQHIKDRLANRPSMTASPEASAPAVRPGMVFQPPEGAQPSASDLTLPPSMARPEPASHGPPGSEAPRPELPVSGPPPGGPEPGSVRPPAGPAPFELDVPVVSELPGRLPAPATTPSPPAPAEAPFDPSHSVPAAPSPVAETPVLRDVLAAASAPTEAFDLPVAPPSSPAVPPAAELPPRPAESAESVLEALPPLQTIAPEGPGDDIWTEAPPAGRRTYDPPDDEPTLSSWNLEDASLDPPSPGSVLLEADAVIGQDPSLLGGDLGPVADASLQGTSDEASIPPPGLSFDSTYPDDEPVLDGAVTDLEAGEKRRRPAWLLPALGIVALVALGLGFFWESRSTDPAGSGPEVPTPGEVSSPAAGSSAASQPPVDEPADQPPVESETSSQATSSPPPPVATPRPATPRPAAPQPAAPPSTVGSGFERLVGIEWQDAPGGLLLSFTLDGEITDERYRHFRLGGDPAREVVQFLGVKGRFARNQMAIGGPGVEQLRIGFHRKSRGDELHVVLDMQDARAQVTDITATGSRLLVRVATDP